MREEVAAREVDPRYPRSVILGIHALSSFHSSRIHVQVAESRDCGLQLHDRARGDHKAGPLPIEVQSMPPQTKLLRVHCRTTVHVASCSSALQHILF